MNKLNFDLLTNNFEKNLRHHISELEDEEEYDSVEFFENFQDITDIGFEDTSNSTLVVTMSRDITEDDADTIIAYMFEDDSEDIQYSSSGRDVNIIVSSIPNRFYESVANAKASHFSDSLLETADKQSSFDFNDTMDKLDKLTEAHIDPADYFDEPGELEKISRSVYDYWQINKEAYIKRAGQQYYAAKNAAAARKVAREAEGKYTEADALIDQEAAQEFATVVANDKYIPGDLMGKAYDAAFEKLGLSDILSGAKHRLPSSRDYGRLKPLDANSLTVKAAKRIGGLYNKENYKGDTADARAKAAEKAKLSAKVKEAIEVLHQSNKHMFDDFVSAGRTDDGVQVLVGYENYDGSEYKTYDIPNFDELTPEELATVLLDKGDKQDYTVSH